jgi:hypothetical protein
MQDSKKKRSRTLPSTTPLQSRQDFPINNIKKHIYVNKIMSAEETS